MMEISTMIIDGLVFLVSPGNWHLGRYVCESNLVIVVEKVQGW
jgi:hypothetical protein